MTITALDPDGSVPDGIAEQAETVWGNLLAILAAAGMGPGEVVSASATCPRSWPPGTGRWAAAAWRAPW